MRIVIVALLAVASLSLAACVQGSESRDQPTLMPMALSVVGPTDGQVVSSQAVVVHGTTQPGATVSVGGRSVVADADGKFQMAVSLTPGENQLEIEAVGEGDERLSNNVTVTYEPPAAEAFFLVISEPLDQTIVSSQRLTVAGQTTSNAVVSVNGVGVGVDGSGAFRTEIVLEDGPNVIDIVGSSPDGRVLSTVLAVIYLP